MDTRIHRHQKVCSIFLITRFCSKFLLDRILSARKAGSGYRMVSWLVFQIRFRFPSIFLIHAGQCLVTLGTGPGPDNWWRDIQLLPSHSYAVIGEFWVNPLVVQLSVHNRRAWNGWRPCVHRSGFLGSIQWRREGSIKYVLSHPVEYLSWTLAGTMQIFWSEVMNSFDGVYLSWDPEMWQHSLTFHGYPLFFLTPHLRLSVIYRMWKRCGEDNRNGSHLFNSSFHPLLTCTRLETGPAGV